MNNQSKAYNLFHKQQEKGRVSHAYLVVGKNDAFSFAQYMAQSLLCPMQAVGACQQCKTCQRIAEDNHGDYIHVSAKEVSIKKDDILSLKEAFSQTEFEQGSRQVYILEDVDNASISALNAILKFLEEPEGDVVAILTTSNPNHVLDTIQSRCVIIPLEETNPQTFYDLALAMDIPDDDATILSHLAKNEASLQELMNSDTYHQTKDIVIDFLSRLNDNHIHEAVVGLQVDAVKLKKIDKDSIHMFFEIAQIVIDSKPTSMHYQYIQKIPTQTRLDYKKILLMIQDRVRPGVNTNLIFDQLAYEIIECHRQFVL